MEVLLMFGRENMNGFPIESYLLSVDCNYVSAEYNEHANERKEFFERATSLFAGKFAEWTDKKDLNLSVRRLNGLKIDAANKPTKVEKLEEKSISDFSQQFSEKVITLIKGRAAINRAADAN